MLEEEMKQEVDMKNETRRFETITRETRLNALKQKKAALPKTEDGAEGKLNTIEEDEMESLGEEAQSVIRQEEEIDII